MRDSERERRERKKEKERERERGQLERRERYISALIMISHFFSIATTKGL